SGLDAGGDVADRRVEPDVEDLVLEARFRDRHAPVEVAGDAAVAQAFLQPLVRNRADQWRPVATRVEPVAQPTLQGAKLQEQMAGFAELNVCRTRNRRARLTEVLGIEQSGAGLALVAAAFATATVGTGADDVAVGQEAPVGRRVGLADRALLDESCLVE